MWIRQASAAEGLLQNQSPENQQRSSFLNGKIAAANYYVQWELPLIQRDIQILEETDATCDSMQSEWF
jgi:butyryl-CoA dehydrogenase